MSISHLPGTVCRAVSHGNGVGTAKKALRKMVEEALRPLPDSTVQRQSEAVYRHVISSRAFRESKTVSCYLSMKGEIDTFEIAREIIRSGKSLYVPKITNRMERRMDFFRVYNPADLESLPSGSWGIKEPELEFEGRRRASILDDDTAQLDLVLVPGVAFDEAFSRLGHGKGYYDVFINAYASNRPYPTLLALSLREQMLPPGQIPMVEHDRGMDAIATSDGIIYRAAA